MRSPEVIWLEAALKHSADGLEAVRNAAIEQAQREAIADCATIADNLDAGVVAYHIRKLAVPHREGE